MAIVFNIFEHKKTVISDTIQNQIKKLMEMRIAHKRNRVLTKVNKM